MSRIRREQIRQSHWLWPFLGPYRTEILTGAGLLVVGTLLSLSIPWFMGQMIDKAMGGEGSSRALLQLALALGGSWQCRPCFLLCEFDLSSPWPKKF